ncbi:tyrosine-type recombinase/integrase [Melghiribacillus thermohalophilus]|uniref:tyrosine-type recombinase/integrase n=1 Tax=Melghiribacillus thermohalophilus TaxID=1324956 RepID=UPI00311DB1A1
MFSFGGFKQSEQLAELLKKLDIKKTTFHGLRDTHASFLFSQDIDIAYVSKRLGHINIQTTQNYYLELMPEKKASARCRCFKSVKCFIRFKLI